MGKELNTEVEKENMGVKTMCTRQRSVRKKNIRI